MAVNSLGQLGLTYGGQDKPPSLAGETEYASEAGAPGGLFHADYKRHDDLKQMLDSNKDSLKLEAMKRIIGVLRQNILITIYCIIAHIYIPIDGSKRKRCIWTISCCCEKCCFQKYWGQEIGFCVLGPLCWRTTRFGSPFHLHISACLKGNLFAYCFINFSGYLSTYLNDNFQDPNQLIRASALRVLSSIRVPVIVPIMMLAIRDSVGDLSPYMRKTAAHAIPKLYDLDPEQKDELVSVIERLLSDQTTLVVGSAVMAFEQVSFYFFLFNNIVINLSFLMEIMVPHFYSILLKNFFDNSLGFKFIWYFKKELFWCLFLVSSVMIFFSFRLYNGSLYYGF